MVIDKLSFGLKVWTLEIKFEIQDYFFSMLWDNEFNYLIIIYKNITL